MHTQFGKPNALSRSITVATVAVVIVIIAVAGYAVLRVSQPNQKYVTLGLALPLSDPIGQDSITAADMAVSQINNNGGVVMNGSHYLLKTVTEDTHEMDPSIPVDQGVAAFQKLVTSDGAQIVLGGVRSDIAVAEAAKVAGDKIVFVDVGSNEPIVEQEVLTDYANYQYYFHTFINGSAMGPSLVEFPMILRNYTSSHSGWPNVTNVAILAENALWDAGLVGRPVGNATFINVLKQVGFNVVYANLFSLDTQDFSTYLSQIAASKAGMVLLFFSSSDGTAFIEQWQSYNWPNGVKPVVFGPGARGGYSPFWTQTNGAAQGMIPWPSTVNVSVTATTVPFIDAFYAKTGHTPQLTALGMYDSIHILALAMHNANTWKANRLAPAMESITYVGTLGTIHFTRSHGLNLPQVPMFEEFGQWQNGHLVPIWNSTSTSISPSIIRP